MDNLLKLHIYSAATAGAGTSIAIVGRSNITLTDVAAFRSIAGLAANIPAVILVGTDPGLVAGDPDEATLDVEWSGAVAPSAAVKLVVGASTATSDGVNVAAAYAVNYATSPVVSASYASCEQQMGASELAFYNSLWEQAASQGMSVFVASGDAGAAGCSSALTSSGSGAAVNGMCSSPYSTCVGGTEFNEGSSSTSDWSSTNSATYGSALGYIPETVWNESASNGGSGLWASGGGASQVYAQPVWQQGVSGASASNGMRAVPDVAMSAANHDGYALYENGSMWIVSGTSAAAPSFAGVMALVVESIGGVGQGNANPRLYSLLNAAQSPFHPTPSGDNSVPGVGGFTASGTAYNLATGLGSVDGALLVSSWDQSTGADFVLSASAASGSVQAGETVSFTLSVTESGSAKAAVALAATAPTGISVSVQPAAILPGTQATMIITGSAVASLGTQTITITGSNASGTQSLAYVLTVTQPPTLTLGASSTAIPLVVGASTTMNFTVSTGGLFNGSIRLSVSGLPTGVTVQWSANPLTPASSVSANRVALVLAASALATVASVAIVVTASGDGLVSSQNFTLQVQAASGIKLAASPASLSMPSQSTATVVVTATPMGGAVASVAVMGSHANLSLRYHRGVRPPLIIPPVQGVATASAASISLVSGLPKGFTASWSVPAMTAASSVTWMLTLTGSSAAVACSSTLNLVARVTDSITGSAYTVSQSVPVTVTLTSSTHRGACSPQALRNVLSRSGHSLAMRDCFKSSIP
jgi:uncharacterized protein (DUF58 family)